MTYFDVRDKKVVFYVNVAEISLKLLIKIFDHLKNIVEVTKSLLPGDALLNLPMHWKLRGQNYFSMVCSFIFSLTHIGVLTSLYALLGAYMSPTLRLDGSSKCISFLIVCSA